MHINYNTQRPHLVIREYGRHIQEMVNYVITVEDAQKRQKIANMIVDLMAYLNPHLKTIEEYRHKLWDHLFLISGFKLDVQSPYPKPTPEQFYKKPQCLTYPKRYPKFLHLGKNIELLIRKAEAESDAYKKQMYIHVIIYCMKQAYANWHKDSVQDDALKQELQTLTQNALLYQYEPELKRMFQLDKGTSEIIKKTDKFQSSAKKTKGGGNSYPQGSTHKNYNHSSSSNVSHALPAKKAKFKRYK